MSENSNPNNLKLNILIVEDDNFLKDLLGEQLTAQSMPFRPTYAFDGKQAVEAMATEKPSIVLLDIRLPGEKDGLDVLEWMRENDRTKDLPVLILSNYNQEDYVRKGEKLGIEGYLVKANFSLREIIQQIKKIVDEYYPDFSNETLEKVAEGEKMAKEENDEEEEGEKEE